MAAKPETLPGTASAAELNRQFSQEGYVCLSQFLQPKEAEDTRDSLLKDMHARLEELPREHVYFEEKGAVDTLKQVQQLHKHFPSMAELAERRFKPLAEALLGEPATLQNMQFFNKPPSKSKDTPAHQDGFYFMITPQSACTMWVALDEADEDNGCVWYVKGSAGRGMRPHEASGLLGFSQKCSDYGTEEDLKNEMPMRAAPGDVVVHHSLMLHRAGPNVTAARPRRALGLIFYGQVSIDEERHAAYQAELAKRLQSDGII